MNDNELILNELREISSAVANINRGNVYHVPSGYFSELADRVLSYVKEHLEEVEGESSALTYKVPQGYFENLSTQILGKIKQQHTEENEVARELAEIAPFLNSIAKSTPYTLPTGYFETLQIIGKKTGAPAKVVSIKRARRFLRYAAAAAITGIMAVGGIFYMNNQSVTDTVAVSHFKNDDLQNLSEEEIVEYLESNSTTGVVSSRNVEQDQKLKDTRELSEEEIIKFLQENPEPGDAYQVEI